MSGREPRLDGSGRLVLEPVGVLRCARRTKVEAPRQPAAADDLTGVIELLPGHNYEHALADLDGWERIWVLFWFHHNDGWRPKVLPPRSSSGRKGVFATRAPHRPNPLGLSALRLLRVDGLAVHVAGVDLLDGTPVLDLKPYVAYTDAWPESRNGWLAGANDPAPSHVVTLEPLTESQLAWIDAREAQPLRDRILATLALGPQPHPYRRIRRDGNDGTLAVRDWRVRFSIVDGGIVVRRVDTGYRASQLDAADAAPIHREFVAIWGTS